MSTINFRLYDSNTYKTTFRGTIEDNSLTILEQFIRKLEPEDKKIFIEVDNLQMSISYDFLGYFTEYSLAIREGGAEFEVLKFDSANEIVEFVSEYLTNAIQALTAWE